MDAADEFSNIVDSYDAMRADLAEFRHETRRELGAVNARLDAVHARLDAANARFDSCATKADLAELKSEFKDALLLQTRWILAGLLTVVLAIYFRT